LVFVTSAVYFVTFVFTPVFFNFKMRTSRLLLLTLTFLSQFTAAQSVTIAQLSDLHIGIANHPGSEERLQQAIDMIRSRHVDAVFVSGDIGDKFEESWNTARSEERRVGK